MDGIIKFCDIKFYQLLVTYFKKCRQQQLYEVTHWEASERLLQGLIKSARNVCRKIKSKL